MRCVSVHYSSATGHILNWDLCVCVYVCERERGREGGRGRQSETRRALLGEQSRTLESRRRHASPGARKEEEETRSEPPPREDATQPG